MKGTPHVSLASALEAIGNLADRQLSELFRSGLVAAHYAHTEIELAPINLKTSPFYQHFVPFRKTLESLLASTYRRYFKLALAHPRETGNPDQWAWQAIQPAISTTLGWLRDWFILACDGENQYVQEVASAPAVPGGSISLPLPLTLPPPSPRSWRAPCWLFLVAPNLGILLLRSEHVPANDSEEKLTVAHTRLILKGARRAFLWDLENGIETARDEEIAAAGAIPAQATGGGQTGDPGQTGEPKKPKHWSRGIEGLTRRADLSRYKHGLTEKQELAFSLKYEYQVGPAEVAARMGIDRKTAYEHIEAVDRKIKQLHSNEKRATNRAKSTPDNL